jgi:signal peptidase II
VVDFIDVGPWPVFNLADSSIVVGITLLVTLFLLEERSARSRASDLTPRGEGVPATEE